MGDRSQSAKEVIFISKEEAIDTTTATGKFMLDIVDAIAELEREYLLQRQITIAKTACKYKGPKRIESLDFDKVVSRWRPGEITAAAKAMELLHLSRNTFIDG